MKQFEKKSVSAVAFVEISAVALIGISAIILGKGRISNHLQSKSRLKNNSDITAMDNKIGAILSENTLLRNHVEQLVTSLDKLAVQNEKLLTSNTNFAQALEEEHERVVKLMTVITEENEEKLLLTQKLEETHNKLLAYAATKSEGTETPGEAITTGFIA